MSTRVVKPSVVTVQGLDPFRSRRAQDVANRWEKAIDTHRKAAQRMWLGTIVGAFDDFELGVLNDMGFLSLADRSLLKQAGRPVATEGGEQ